MAERVFRNLFQARDEVCRGLVEMEVVIGDLRGDLSAVQGLGQSLAQDHGEEAEVIGLMHCAERAMATLRRLDAMVTPLHEAAFVAKGNDSTRLSAEALRYSPGPHREDYSKGIEADPEGGEAADA